MSVIADAGRPGGSLRRIGGVAIRHWCVTRRSPRILDIAVWPVFNTLLYGSIAVYARDSGGGSASTRTVISVVTGIVMWHVMYLAQNAVSNSFFHEIYTRQLASLLTTPLRPAEWVLGAALEGLIKVGVGVGAVTVASAVMFGVHVTDAGLAIAPVMALLLLTGWAMALLVVGVVMFLGSGTETLAWGLLLVIMPLSGVFYPVSVLPAVIRPISAVLPTTYAFNAARTVVDGSGSPWGSIGVAAVATAVLMAASFTFAVFSLRSFLRRGLISKYT